MRPRSLPSTPGMLATVAFITACQSWDEGGLQALRVYAYNQSTFAFEVCGAPIPDLTRRVTTGQGIDRLDVTDLRIHVDSDTAAHGTAAVRIHVGSDFRAELPASCQGRVQFSLDREVNRQFMYFVPGDRRVSATGVRVVAGGHR